ncbi:MAG: ABC transporter ATP-binding protein [Bacillota bacterium]|nr:ABC transporter ATP-binding protein [Bacillota bacterium]
MTLLNIRDLRTHFFTGNGLVRAVDGIDLSIDHGKTEGLVGESGCGKSVTALSIMKLLPRPGKTVGGKIIFEGEDLLLKTPREMSKIRGEKISMIFQEPLSSLNPVLRSGKQIEEAIRLHQGLSRQDAQKEAVRMMELVGIPSPSARARNYPHQLSGGMRQRVMIAMALSCNPSLLIADEPTTALDVTIQAQILELLKELIRELNTSMLLITHDFGIVAELCDMVSVMYAGNIVERASTRAIFKKPMHPYTRGLLNSIPRIDLNVDRLESITGAVPNLAHPPGGCLFNPRCQEHEAICHRKKPLPVEIEPEHFVSCWKYCST